MKTAELAGPALDWAVAQCLGVRTYFAPYQHTMTGICVLDADLVDMSTDGSQELRYSRSWEQGGPIIEQARIRIDCPWNPGPFEATCKIDGATGWCKGQTVLEAAMRCFVTAKLGDEVELPEELLTYS